MSEPVNAQTELRFASDVRPTTGQMSGGWPPRAATLQDHSRRALVVNLLRQDPMTLPRRITHDRAWMVTRRCTQRQFLLRPDEETNNAFLYCIIEAAQISGVQLVLAQMMSNHNHESVVPGKGSVVDFYSRFHTNLAKCVNMQRGRWENMWASEPTCAVEAIDREDWMRQLVYIATNPVKDGLVEKVHHWPGPKFVQALLHKRPLKATRPRFFREGGRMPETVELTPTIPPALGDPDVVIAELQRRIVEVEAECARARAASGRSVVGRRRILRQSWRDCPSSWEPRRTLRPRVAAVSKWARTEALQRNQDFIRDYRAARAVWLAGGPAVFPVGTFWLARHANVMTFDARASPTVTN